MKSQQLMDLLAVDHDLGITFRAGQVEILDGAVKIDLQVRSGDLTRTAQMRFTEQVIEGAGPEAVVGLIRDALRLDVLHVDEPAAPTHSPDDLCG